MNAAATVVSPRLRVPCTCPLQPRLMSTHTNQLPSGNHAVRATNKQTTTNNNKFIPCDLPRTTRCPGAEQCSSVAADVKLEAALQAVRRCHPLRAIRQALFVPSLQQRRGTLALAYSTRAALLPRLWTWPGMRLMPATHACSSGAGAALQSDADAESQQVCKQHAPRRAVSGATGGASGVLSAK